MLGILVFDETDGTEVDDDEGLLEYDKGSVLILGQEWKAANATSPEDTGGKDTASKYTCLEYTPIHMPGIH